MCTKALLLFMLTSVTYAHMYLYFPLTLKGNNNLYTYSNADPFLNYLYKCSRKKAPSLYKGYLGLLDTEETKPVIT